MKILCAIFQGRIGLLVKRNFDKHLIYNTWKESPTGKHFGVFFWILRVFWMRKFIQQINTVVTFFSLPSFSLATSFELVFSNVIKKHRYSHIETVNVTDCPLAQPCTIKCCIVSDLSLFELKLFLFSNNTF